MFPVLDRFFNQFFIFILGNGPGDTEVQNFRIPGQESANFWRPAQPQGVQNYRFFLTSDDNFEFSVKTGSEFELLIRIRQIDLDPEESGFVKLFLNQFCEAGAGGAEIIWELGPEPKLSF